MENQANSKSIILNYGLFYGIASVILSLAMYATGNHLDQSITSMLLGFAVIIAFVILATKKFKSENNNFLSWGQGVKIGMGVVLIGTIISCIYMYLFANFIEPDFKNQIMEQSVIQWENAGMTEEQIEMYSKATEDYFYLSLYGGIIIGSLFIGFVISAITSTIMKTPEEDQY